MRDLQGAARFGRDCDRLVHRLDELVVLVPHVRRIRKLALRQRLAERDELFS